LDLVHKKENNMSRKAWVIGEKIEICVHAVAQQGHPKTYFKKLKKESRIKKKITSSILNY